jgi:hypothetical protein
MNWDRFLALYSTVKKGPRIQDSFTIGILGGLIGTVVVDISNLLLWRKGRSEMLYGHFGASMFMMPLRTNRRKNFILGQIFHMLTGGFLGLPIFYLLKKTGRDNLWFKGLFGGAAVWGTLYAFGIRMKLYSAKPRLTRTHFSYLWHNFLYGVVSAFSMVWLAEPNTFPNKEERLGKGQEEAQNTYGLSLAAK